MSDTSFSFLSDSLPEKIKINETAISIDTRTSTAIAVLLYLRANHSQFEKAHYTALRLFCKPYNEVLKVFDCDEDILDVAMVKYLHGAPYITSSGGKAEKPHAPSFDFVQDSASIIASFRQMYGLCIRDVKNLHWWEFLALFNNLTGENSFCQIRNIRTMEIDRKHDSPERQAEIRRAKESVKLVDTRTTEQKKADLNAMFNEAF